MNNERKWVVYSHTNKVNGKKYIGISSNLDLRWGSNGNSYARQFFGKAIRKYGWDNFEHQILFKNLSKDEACAMEQQLIKEFDTTNKDKGYNISTGGESGSYGSRYRKKSVTKEVYQYDIQGNFIKKFDSIAIAVKEVTNKDTYRTCSISSCCEGKRLTAIGYRWFYEYQGKKIDALPNLQERIHNPLKIKIYQYSLDGNFIRDFDSIKEAKNNYGGGIYACLNGKFPRAYGYQWFKEYKGERIEPIVGRFEAQVKTQSCPRYPVYQYDLDGNFIAKYEDRKEAAKKYNVLAIQTYETIGKPCVGYIWSNKYCPQNYFV